MFWFGSDHRITYILAPKVVRFKQASQLLKKIQEMSLESDVNNYIFCRNESLGFKNCRLQTNHGWTVYKLFKIYEFEK